MTLPCVSGAAVTKKKRKKEILVICFFPLQKTFIDPTASNYRSGVVDTTPFKSFSRNITNKNEKKSNRGKNNLQKIKPPFSPFHPRFLAASSPPLALRFPPRSICMLAFHVCGIFFFSLFLFSPRLAWRLSQTAGICACIGGPALCLPSLGQKRSLLRRG